MPELIINQQGFSSHCSPIVYIALQPGTSSRRASCCVPMLFPNLASQEAREPCRAMFENIEEWLCLFGCDNIL